jgi:hypothetical protein
MVDTILSMPYWRQSRDSYHVLRKERRPDHIDLRDLVYSISGIIVTGWFAVSSYLGWVVGVIAVLGSSLVISTCLLLFGQYGRLGRPFQKDD